MDKNLEREIELLVLKNRKNILPICGSSMCPTLKENWRAEVKPVTKEEVKFGDIIVFDTGREVAVHRAVGMIYLDGKAGFLQKGDGESVPHFVEAKDLIGRVYRVFDSSGQEVPLGLWRHPFKSQIVVLRLLSILYLILYRLKRFVFGNRKTRLVKLFWRLYWKLFFNCVRRQEG